MAYMVYLRGRGVRGIIKDQKVLFERDIWDCQKWDDGEEQKINQKNK